MRYYYKNKEIFQSDSGSWWNMEDGSHPDCMFLFSEAEGRIFIKSKLITKVNEKAKVVSGKDV